MRILCRVRTVVLVEEKNTKNPEKKHLLFCHVNLVDLLSEDKVLDDSGMYTYP